MKIDQAELNLIFRPGARVEADVMSLLQRYPEVALTACWKYRYERYGLSPFVLHYLTKSKVPIEKYAQRLKRSRINYYAYCYSTRLPVVFSIVGEIWDNPGTYRRKYVHTRSNNPDRDGRFAVLLEQYKKDLAEGKMNDEYMRTFGRTTIAKETWNHLKVIAGIYQ